MTTTRRHAVLLAPLVSTLLPLSALAGPQATVDLADGPLGPKVRGSSLELPTLS